MRAFALDTSHGIPARLRFRVWQYRVSRLLARALVSTLGTLSLDRMPPFVSAAAIIVRGDLLLMVRDHAQGALVLPGGHLHWGERVEDGLRREVWEETGYVVEPDEILKVYSGAGAPVDRGIVRIVLKAAIVGGDARSSPEGDVSWVTVKDAMEEVGRDAPIIAELAGHLRGVDEVRVPPG
ncbi:MAG TPA: NUDIX hydrolase [Chloroflexota bacterium]|nr:NUDIX hydrolase [Chloroflexota bacterium]